jgi:hypothetical protein
MGESPKLLKVHFDRRMRVEFRSATITSEL